MKRVLFTILRQEKEFSIFLGRKEYFPLKRVLSGQPRYIGISYFSCNFRGSSLFLVADAAIVSILLPLDSVIHLLNYFLFTK